MLTLARRTALAAPRVSLLRTLQTGPRDTSTAKQTLPGDIKPTAWKARKEQAHEAGVIGAWPAVWAVVAVGAVTLYFTTGKGKTDLAQNIDNPPATYKK
ncbi:hypothetical protein JCM10450v2_000406 [Rhodotorula kratochvilovae]